jgi:hypothetical protein
MRTVGGIALAFIVILCFAGDASAHRAPAIWQRAPGCRAADVSLRAKALGNGMSFRLTMTNVREQTCSITDADTFPPFYDRFGNRTAFSDRPIISNGVADSPVVIAEGESAFADVRSSDEAAQGWLRGLFDGRFVGCVRPAAVDVRIDRRDPPKRIPVPAGVRLCPITSWNGGYTYPAYWQAARTRSASSKNR